MIREVLDTGASDSRSGNLPQQQSQVSGSSGEVGSATGSVLQWPAPVATTVQRLRVPMPDDRRVAWVLTVLITAIAFVIRLVDLGRPNKLIFDETYYAKDGYSLLKFGYERAWPESANASITSGTPDVMNANAAFIVHPQIGKWLIAGGEYLFGMNSFGWRFASVVFGSLLVLVTIRLVRRVSRSTLIGCLAGLLLTLDGLAFFMSRIALLDIFLAFFLVSAVACLAVDRDWFRARLADHLERGIRPDLAQTFGPALMIRPWRIAAGVCFGLALGTKWNALYLLAVFALLSLAWDIGARRLAGAGRRAYWGLLRDGVPAFISLVLVSAVVYVASWASWLATSGGWLRDWGQTHPGATSVKVLGPDLASLLQYNKAIWDFHNGDFINNATHSYAAHPAGWLILARPIAIDSVNDIQPGTAGCSGPETCVQVVIGIGTPILWWGALIALIFAALLWVGGRDWRFGIPVVGALGAWLPWFAYTDRPLFFFYAITIIPFSVMALALCIGWLLGPADGPRRRVAAIGAGAFVALVAANFAYLYPVLTDEVITRTAWVARMWFRTWI